MIKILTEAGRSIFKVSKNCDVWLRMFVKYGKYTLTKFAKCICTARQSFVHIGRNYREVILPCNELYEYNNVAQNFTQNIFMIVYITKYV